jgi:NADH-quinone oxidoreductase subunit H
MMQIYGIPIEPWMMDTAVLLAKVVFMITLVMTAGALMSWVERKQAGLVQDRLGANRADIKLFGRKITLIGLLHIPSDGIKGITKEDYIPPQANAFLHGLAPFLATFTVLAAFAAIPFGGSFTLPFYPKPIALVLVPMEMSLLYVFAILSVGVYGLILAGYASKSKLASLGALRATAQVLSYEVTLGMTLMGVFLIYGSLDLTVIAQGQMRMLEFKGWHLPVPAWGVFLQPLGFLLFAAAAVVETKRIPFDLPEGESEIVGYFVEYSGMKFLMFMMAEMIEMVLFAWLMVLLFFGGWHVPGLHFLPEGMSGFYVHGRQVLAVHGAWVIALQALAFASKVVFFIWLLMQVRWTLVRFRYDQMMRLGWKIMLPLSLANVAFSAILAQLLR